MIMTRRKIVRIDEEKCDGCGLCVPSCAEGAIRIVDGKARLVSDVYCDGLGACLGHCPRGAISIIEREAEAFDEALATASAHAAQQPPSHSPSHSGCPGAAAIDLRLKVLSGAVNLATKPAASNGRAQPEDSSSGLANWPVQLRLVPPQAPYLQGADLLLVADCVPFACADFHRRFLDGRPVAIGCPKLDDGQFYVEKLAQIIRQAGLRSLTVVHMEVPCCLGLVRIAQAAIELSGVDIPLHHATISIRGEERVG
jgi:Pyruvate/2-oxoacid:ferredoxin oxidoreductase delta subunit